MVVGLTGGIGSGKSTVAKLFQKTGNIALYNADVEAKKLMNNSEELRSKIIEEYGIQAYTNGELNTGFLAGIVFHNSEKLATLNSLVHPVVYKDLNRFIEIQQSVDFVLYENAILFENSSDSFCDVVITVVAPVEVRLSRVMKRDAVSKESVLARINKQWNDEKKILQSNYIIHNVDLQSVEEKIKKIHKKLTKYPLLN